MTGLEPCGGTSVLEDQRLPRRCGRGRPPGYGMLRGKDTGARGETSGATAHASFTVRTDWPEFHFDPANTGLNPYENVLDPSNVSGLTPLWTTALDEAVQASSVVAGGLVYVGVRFGTFYA